MPDTKSVRYDTLIVHVTGTSHPERADGVRPRRACAGPLVQLAGGHPTKDKEIDAAPIVGVKRNRHHVVPDDHLGLLNPKQLHVDMISRIMNHHRVDQAKNHFT